MENNDTFEPIEDNWKSISDYEAIPDDVTVIHVDTRDWCAYMKTEDVDWKKVGKIHDAILFSKDNRFRINSSSLLQLLNNLKAWTGGDADWRMFNLKRVKASSGWFKYIRCYRVPGTDEWVMTDGEKAIRISEFTEDNIDKEYLNVCY